jgi:hypothetical protein
LVPSGLKENRFRLLELKFLFFRALAVGNHVGALAFAEIKQNVSFITKI